MSYSIQCVHCQAVLKSPAPVPEGKKVRCPKCKEVFTTPAEGQARAPTHAIQCQHCKAVLKSATPVPAGKKVACPKCKQAFIAPGEGPAPRVAPPPPLAPPKPPPYVAPAGLNISIFSGDMDAAIASLQSDAGAKKPAPAPDPSELVTEDEDPEVPKPLDEDVLPFAEDDAGKDQAKKEPKKKNTW